MGFLFYLMDLLSFFTSLNYYLSNLKIAKRPTMMMKADMIADVETRFDAVVASTRPSVEIMVIMTIPKASAITPPIAVNIWPLISDICLISLPIILAFFKVF